MAAKCTAKHGTGKTTCLLAVAGSMRSLPLVHCARSGPAPGVLLPPMHCWCPNAAPCLRDKFRPRLHAGPGCGMHMGARRQGPQGSGGGRLLGPQGVGMLPAPICGRQWCTRAPAAVDGCESGRLRQLKCSG